MPGVEWQRKCGIIRVAQEDDYGCGVACLAMVTGRSYAEARKDFVALGLADRRAGRPALGVSVGELRMAVSAAGLIAEPRRWKGWDSVDGLGIFKMKADWRGPKGKGKWSWAVAFRHPEFGITVFDPHQDIPSFERMPMDEVCLLFSVYEPKGHWLQVEHRIPLSIEPAQA
ncbi:TPA: hypothetical protein ACKP9S_006478 [Pseudomonas aeruginosa]